MKKVAMFFQLQGYQQTFRHWALAKGCFTTTIYIQKYIFWNKQKLLFPESVQL